MTETIEELQEANRKLAKDYKRAKASAENLKAEASKAKYYKNKFQEKESALSKVEYDLKISKIMAKAATTGVKFGDKLIKVTLDEQKLSAFDKCLSGKGQQEQLDYVKSHLQDFCAVAVKSTTQLSKCSNDHAGKVIPAYDSVFVVSPEVLKYLYALGITWDLTPTCQKNIELLKEISITQVCLMEDQYSRALENQNSLSAIQTKSTNEVSGQTSAIQSTESTNEMLHGQTTPDTTAQF